VKGFRLFLVFVVAAGILLSVSGPGASGQRGLDPLDGGSGPPDGVVPDNYIVLLQDGASAENVAGDHGLAPRFVYKKALNGFAGFIPAAKLDAVSKDLRVKSVHSDRIVTAVPDAAKGKPGGGGGGGVGQVSPPNVARVKGNALQTGAGVGIAVLDTGIDLANADLRVGAAYFDAFGGSGQDGDGHGTHVAGIAAALNNTVGVVGVAPGATVYSVRVLDNTGSGSDATIIAGLDWIVSNAGTYGIRVTNASLGRKASADDSLMRAAVQRVVNAGVVFIAAAGNDPAIEVSSFVPAGFPESIAVSSTTAVAGSNAGYRFYSGVIGADTASYYTTDGDAVRIAAPGEEKENISKAGLIGTVGILSLKPGGGTTRMSGTSMAAPHVAGLVALLLESNPAGTVGDLSSWLTQPNTDRDGVAPLNSPASSYSFDGRLEGIGYAPEALAASAN